MGPLLTLASGAVLALTCLMAQGLAVSAATVTVPIDGWHACEDGPDVIECTTLDVPLDYADPAGEWLSLAVRRLTARAPGSRIGTLVVIAGGPGQRGTDLVAEGLHSPLLRDRFDIVSWDPRGTAGPSSIDCISDWDPYAGLDRTPDDPAEQQAFDERTKELTAGCLERHGRLLGYVGTSETAQDLERLRRSLGEERISILGSSYGTDVALVYATRFPGRVRALVLDGPTDPERSPVEVILGQAAGFERALEALLADCAAEPACELGTDETPGDALDRLLGDLDLRPLPTDIDGRELDQSDAYEAITGSLLHGVGRQRSLLGALGAASSGDGTPLLTMADEVRSAYEASGLTLGPFAAIGCADEAGYWSSLEVTDLERFEADLAATAPRLGRWLWPRSGDDQLSPNGLCAMTPEGTASDRIPIDLTRLGHALVLATSGDPTTPLEGAYRLADRLPVVSMVVLEAPHHLAYYPAVTAPSVERYGCVLETVERYLIDPAQPATEQRCH